MLLLSIGISVRTNMQVDGLTPISWGQVKTFTGYLGVSLAVKQMTWSHFPIANTKYERIKKDPRFKNQKPRDTVALSPSDELKFTEAGTGEAF